MSRSPEDPYLQAVWIFGETCGQKFRDDVWAILVMGSVARNEHVVGKSDIEMVCVLRKEINDVQRIGAIQESFKKIMKEKGIPKSYLEILRPSEYERAYLYLDLFSTNDLKLNGKVVYGEDIRFKFEFPSRERLKELAELHISSLSRSAYKVALSCGPNLDSIPDEIIEALSTHVAFAAGAALIGYGVMVSLKREILNKFTKTFPELETYDEIMKGAKEEPPKNLEEKNERVKSCLSLLDELSALYSRFLINDSDSFASVH